jgi:mono/diheme cytochrome c family protein
MIVLAIMSALAAGATPILGDPGNGARLYREYCVGCHGAGGRGDGYLSKHLTPPPADLRSPALQFSRTNDALFDTINQGGAASKHSFLMPSFNRALGALDVWDLVALLRQRQLSVDDSFPDAMRYAVKRYAIDDDGAKRLHGVLGNDLSPDERQVDIASVFGTGRSPLTPAVYVPQEPVALDSLKPKEKVGYVALFEVPASEVFPPASSAKATKKKAKGSDSSETAAAPGSAPFAWNWPSVPLAIALDRDGVLKSISVGGDVAERARAAAVLSAFSGQGGKRSDKRPEYKALRGPKGGDAVAKLINRLYYRGLEAAIMFDKEEAERHWADSE